MEILGIEVVDFKGSYHSIFGCPCYTKFMAVPIYTYLKLKVLGPNGVIILSASFEHVFMVAYKTTSS